MAKNDNKKIFFDFKKFQDSYDSLLLMSEELEEIQKVLKDGPLEYPEEIAFYNFVTAQMYLIQSVLKELNGSVLGSSLEQPSTNEKIH